ncbi:AraC family transcriptional regulator [Pseudorhodobacter sp. W20_MBD10_FR17]|uniref:AraC family transcriptional regulator n=1 Tax=Pseudorhodobacter sp. W20_MBD10_FR17 TaxID=3240266 RepID=UPI003F9EB972
MDPLSDILELVGVQSSIYFQKDFCGPWKMSVDNTGFAQFHFVIRGGAIVDSDGAQSLLSAGDIVLFPKGATHTIGDHPASIATPGTEVIAGLQNGAEPFIQGPLATTMVCGHFEYDLSHPHPMIRHLPNQIILRTNDLPMGNLLLGLLPLIVRETKNSAQGSRVVIQHLSYALFTSILRAYFETTDADVGPYAGLRDARILTALSAIHEPQGWSYSLVDLAQKVGMSRSSFAATFKSLMGQSPGDYAVNWKLLKAKQTLETTQKTIEQVAYDYGYSTASAFTRAFREHIGVNPSFVRTPVFKRGP